MASERERTKLAQQAEQFSAATAIHDDLPAAYRAWSRLYVDDELERLFGVRDAAGFYASSIEARARTRSEPFHVVSIGCGEATIELEVARRLERAGICQVRFLCGDVAPGAIERGRAAIALAGFADRFDLRVAEAAELLDARRFDVVIANQMLHHVVDLEGLFSQVADALGDDGVFLSVDMIGRNGHMLWPEALSIMDSLWQRLPDRYKHNHVLGRHEARYSNWDNSKESNEGIRAQDVLPLLVSRFHFERFFAAGNLSVALFGRSFGDNFDLDVEEDSALVERIGRLDHDLIDIGHLKPVLMFAAMTRRPGARLVCHRHWTPDFCVRPVVDVAATEPTEYRIGDELTFAERAPATACLRDGWSSPEPGGVWSNDATAELVLPLRGDVQGPLRLVLTLMPHIGGAKARQAVRILVSGEVSTVVGFEAPGLVDAVVEVPGASIARSVLELRLEPEDTRSPIELGESHDVRRLGVFLIRCRIEAHPQAKRCPTARTWIARLLG